MGPYLLNNTFYNQNRDYIIGTPIHTNLGDHLIALAQFDFFKKVGYEREIIEIPTEMFQLYKVRLKKAFNRNSRIFINGGGWMGNLWPNEELLMQEILETFGDHQIIVFPQTIYFDENIKPYTELIESANQIYEKCKDLTLFVRDRKSYEIARTIYPLVRVNLVPDIAISYYDSAPKNLHLSKKIVGYCLREDRELFRDYEIELELRTILKQRGYTEKPIDTITKVRIPTFLRENVVKKRLKRFSEYSLIITDRLHGMLFAYLTDTPCIVFDNKTHKISNVYNEWLKHSNSIFPLFKQKEISELIGFIEGINYQKEKNTALESEFRELREIITND